MQRKKDHNVKEKNIKPDHELLVWEKWIQIRQEETTKLAFKLNVQPADLTMNLLEEVREEKEWKTAIEHASIKKKPSIRGGTWEQPVRLKQGCYCEPPYEVQRTAAERGSPNIIEHITVPEYILKVEKGLSGNKERDECPMLDTEFNKYKLKRESVLRHKILKIDPFRPEANDLIVLGSRPKPLPAKVPSLPVIDINQVERIGDNTLCTVYAIRINNTVILKDIPGQNLSHLEKLKKEQWHEPCTTWSYYFNAPAKRAGRCKLFLQNLGTVTLRYCWKKIKRSIPFVPEDIYEQVFFYNKNEDVLSPGQSKEICFTFLSKKPGIYNEFWEISFCNICFFDTLAEKLVVKLFADSVEDVDGMLNKIMLLKTEINEKAIVNIVTDILIDAITNATTFEPVDYPYKNLLLEAEMFVMKNPVCFYHQTEVLKMKDMYAEMLPGETWDLSIASWREAMMAKPFEDRMNYYDLLKRSHADFLKPWYEGDDLIQQKYRAVKYLLSSMADMFDNKYNQLLEIYNITDKTHEENGAGDKIRKFSVILDPLIQQNISNLFYIHAYEYVATTIEICAGVLSSLDLNRWIEFDFCRCY